MMRNLYFEKYRIVKPVSTTDTAGRWRTRAAQRVDAPPMTQIYNQGVEERVGAFEAEPRVASQTRTGSTTSSA